MGYRRRKQESEIGQLVALLCLPVVWLMRRLIGWQRRRASPDEIGRFYRSKEWKELRYTQLIKEPALQELRRVRCGRRAHERRPCQAAASALASAAAAVEPANAMRVMQLGKAGR